MGLQEGKRLGSYEILAPIGAGGMGEVYRARDTKLNREVALKVVPETFANDPQRMARFQREAQVLASLNHPNIAAIYGLEESGLPGQAGATRALVMELVEGQTLAERISGFGVRELAPALESGGKPPQSKTSARRAPLQVDEALEIAKQIAEALEYAHDKGIVHRDLKPANVKVTPEGTVKVLDFGLAKALGPDEVSGEASSSPTLSVAMTQAGFIIGTAAYMAPEQAKGRPVDRRADIWAFGAVLYEMLSGRQPFGGETVSDTLAEVLKFEPDWAALPADLPAGVERLLRRCLEKDPRRRLQAIGEARIAIEEMTSGVGADGVRPLAETNEGDRRSPLRRALPWALAGLLGLAAAIFAAGYFARAPKPQPVISFAVPAPENTNFTPLGPFISLSPDGRKLAFVAQSGASASSGLWVRRLGSVTAEGIQGTNGAYFPFWSLDGQYIAFFANSKLEKVAVSGGPSQTLCAAEAGRGGTWNRDGTILFANKGSLYSVSDAGGTPTLLMAPDKARGESAYLYPQFLPDGRHFIFGISGGAGKFSIAAGVMGSKEITRLAASDSGALYASPGELLYLSGSTLMARPFDAKSLRFTGQAVPVAESVGILGVFGYFSVSPPGVLAYQTAATVGKDQMAWFNRDGKELGTLGQPGIYECPAISPNGASIAVNVGPQGKGDIWVYDLKRGTGSRLTFNPADDLNPVWSADGKRIFFTSERGGQRDIYVKASNGLGTTQLVYASKQSKSLNDVTPEGRYAIYDSGGVPEELGVLPLVGKHKPFAFISGKFSASNGQFSPNGRYLAYTSNETGRDEIYVQTFPKHLGKWQISTAGGVDPVWGHGGKELYYLDPKNQMMEAKVDTQSSAFQAGIPKVLFQAHITPTSYWRSNYVVSRDGKRFLMLVPAGESKSSPITVVVNWPSLLKKP